MMKHFALLVFMMRRMMIDDDEENGVEENHLEGERPMMLEG